MENLISQEHLEDIREIIENKIADVPGEFILFGAIGALLLSSYLGKNGHKQASSIVGKLSIPIIGIGLAKYRDVIKAEIESFQEPKYENLNTES
ncbi:hypothetical protein GON26_00025 [Flavobacterium sp. GA093]|uniref:PrgI family protein n=1 Tax=Flavobacterium hydrocarbonoxydans TaxID=2683249 RepID=A0A6I4NDX3_9FLAO|nr:hypothetical protein [Flavobacterium hydrocarbonoxydans]MWB92740.1 hypothetical protein [Flavobacterium hydrocarbonoxydans]